MSTTLDLGTIFEQPTFDTNAITELKKLALATRESFDRFRELVATLSNAAPSPATSFKMGICQWLMGRPAPALEHFKQAGQSAEALYYTASCLRDTRAFDDAQRAFDSAAAAGYDKVQCAADKAECMLLNGKLDDAEKAVTALAASGGEHPAYHYMTGRIHSEHKRTIEAMDAYERALELNEEHAQSIFQLAYICDLHGSDEEAFELYQQCSDLLPVHVNALINLAVLLEDRGRNREAEQCLRRILVVNPNHPRARLFLKDVASSAQQIIDEDWERRNEENSAILDTPISDFELSIRSRNCLSKLNIHTLGDLLRISETELLAYKNFGETSLNEIKTMLAQKGLKLGQAVVHGNAPIRSAVRKQMAVPTSTGGADHSVRPVSELELSVRSRKCLQRLGIETIGELISRSESELLSIRNFGQTSLNEIKRRLNEMGMSLRNSG